MPAADGNSPLGTTNLRWWGVYNQGPFGGGYTQVAMGSVSGFTATWNVWQIGVTGASGDRIVQLPQAAQFFKGQELTVQDVGGGVNFLTVKSWTGADRINGQTGVTLAAPYAAWRLVSDGASNWYASQGPTGPQGIQGITGVTGATGPTGPAVTGATGPAGPLQTGYAVGISGFAGWIKLGPTGWFGLVLFNQSGASNAGVATGPIFGAYDAGGNTAYGYIDPTGIQSVGMVRAKRLDLSNDAPIGTGNFTGIFGINMGPSGGSYGSATGWALTAWTGNDSAGEYTLRFGSTGYTIGPQWFQAWNLPRGNNRWVMSKIATGSVGMNAYNISETPVASGIIYQLNGNAITGSGPTGLGWIRVKYLALG